MDVAALALIALFVGSMSLPGITHGGLGWSDAPNHALDGVFVYEFVKQWPIAHAREWAEQFYLRYPALGIIVYYPPGFAVVEAGAFALLGVNIVSARLTVVLFAVGAGWLMYLLGRRWFDRPTGLFAGLLLITCPHGFLWMNDVMLEWPATFWILASVYCFERDRAAAHARWAIALAACAVMAYLTKQTAGFILPVLGMYAFVARLPRAYFVNVARALSMVVAVGVIAAYHVATKKYAALPSHLLATSVDIHFYPRHLPEILGWPLLGVALLGMVTMAARLSRGPGSLLMLWFVAWAGFSTVIAAKEPRYFFFAIPPMAFAAVRFFLPAAGAVISWRADKARIVLLAALVLVQAGIARARDVGRLPRFEGAVEELVGRTDADVVLVDAVRDGQVAFDIYQNEAARKRILMLRASKMLYARAAREKYDYQQFVESESNIVRLLDQYGIRYILIESAYPATPYVDADPPPRKMLRNLLTSDPRFRLVRAWPMRCGDPIWNDVELRLYQYPSCPARGSKMIKLSIPAMGREVTFELP
ncbi:MAG: glycosyltransferase family 39 protein [Planctomycetes bacterium]|nr:glycosyltransferase family 39 protein [Planctomycetota bacterium]